MLPSLRVLVVEDDPVAAVLLKGMVENENHTVCQVLTRGSEVLEAVLKNRPDVLLMDIHLEDGIDGLSITREVSYTLQVPVIVITGTRDQQIMDKVAASGAVGFIQKPISADSLRVNLRIAMYRHNKEVKLRASEVRHRNFFDNAAVGIYICNAEGYFISCNKTFASMLGYDDPDELLRLLTFPDEQLYVENTRRSELLHILRTKGEVSGFESKVLTRDGDPLWIEEHCSAVYGADNSLARFEGVVINITARKQAEEAFQMAYLLLQSTVDSVRDAILVTDLSGKLIIANKASRDIFGDDLREGGVLPCREFFADGSPFALFLKDYGPHSGPMQLTPYTNSVFLADTSPYCNPEGQVIGAVHTLRMQEAAAA